MKDVEMAGKRHGMEIGPAAYVTPTIRSFSPTEFLELVGPIAGTVARTPVSADVPPAQRVPSPRRDDH